MAAQAMTSEAPARDSHLALVKGFEKGGFGLESLEKHARGRQHLAADALRDIQKRTRSA